ncbi:unnamed protein product [Protopolystoma xenopodis]|uniref:Uncharacterized protein n=1 Tax=Protopolystoma xenopodis TaxID=117903 RepID=A0A448WYK5_9PLAT|nr:unnamed protein product [Protopolystoma xenopodis]
MEAVKPSSGLLRYEDGVTAQKSVYHVSEQRRSDQKSIDAKVMRALSSQANGRMLTAYLMRPFSLSHADRPHKMVF